ncbi:conserved hypothetical protein [Trichinella spiralis]|uniref:hypothetical protein n=1 Tax=Trichinella spiralis TaxID=6334 RepID=UPI0001EFBA54|nr:conserved hypothetical protein [Trichinella spiralis]
MKFKTVQFIFIFGVAFEFSALRSRRCLDGTELRRYPIHLWHFRLLPVEDVTEGSAGKGCRSGCRCCWSTSLKGELQSQPFGYIKLLSCSDHDGLLYFVE